jgi:hypothetical protein
VSRPVEWTPLASGDPIPGDPELVEQAGRDYRLVAQAIETAASRLRTIAADMSMQSDAVAQIRERADGLAEQVGRAQERYEAIGRALFGYAQSLTEAQASSLKALKLAQDAQANLLSARWCINDAQRRLVWIPDASVELTHAQRREETATAELASARAILEQAISYRDDAAEAARRVIDAAKSHDGLNDSRWDNIKAATISMLESVAKVVDMIAVGAGVLALLFAAVPFVGEFVAAVALLASIASLALKLTLKAFGEGTWLEIRLAVLGVAAFGVGKVAIGSAEGAAAGARLAASRVAAEAPELGAAARVPLESANGAIGDLVGAGRAMSPAAAREAADDVSDLGAAAALREGVESIFELPRTVAEDLTNIGQFDVVHPVMQFRNLTPISPLSFLGERAAALDSAALGQLDEVVLEAPQVARQINIRDVATGAFVTTWLTGTGLLGRDTFTMVRGDSNPVGQLLAGAGP